MQHRGQTKIFSGKQGYSMLELMIVLAIIGILGLTINFTYSPADSRLKSAARDLYSHLQKTRLGAVKTSSDWGIIFDNATSEYFVCSNYNADQDCDDNDTFGTRDEIIEARVSLSDYKSGIQFGEITYNPNHVVYEPSGRLKNVGYIGSVDLKNNKETVFNVGTTSLAGVVKITKP